MTPYIRPRIVSAFRCVQQRKAPSEVVKVAGGALAVMESPVECWRAAGPLLLHLGIARVELEALLPARHALEKALQCTLIDSREVFPHLVKICTALEDTESASEGIIEHILAGGARDQLSVAAGHSVVVPSPPAEWQSWGGRRRSTGHQQKSIFALGCFRDRPERRAVEGRKAGDSCCCNAW